MNYFKCLQGLDVISAKVSDHNPMIHGDVLFWNVMMQAKQRGVRFNNGFGIVESDEEYLNRLAKVAEVINEILQSHPEIMAISLCEGPISSIAGPMQSLPVTRFLEALHQHGAMQRFSMQPYIPNTEDAPAWGLMLFADRRYVVDEMQSHFVKGSSMARLLGNRLQLWRLTYENQDKYIALAHFPFAGNEKVSSSNMLSAQGKEYVRYLTFLLKEYENKDFRLCADFNFNPYLISAWNERYGDQIPANNSILIEGYRKRVNVTVDGILLSKSEKTKFYSNHFHAGLFARLKHEQHLGNQVIRQLTK